MQILPAERDASFIPRTASSKSSLFCQRSVTWFAKMFAYSALSVNRQAGGRRPRNDSWEPLLAR